MPNANSEVKEVIKQPLESYETVCPHCNNVIHEKGISYDFMESEPITEYVIHTACGGRVKIPVDESQQAMIDTLAKASVSEEVAPEAAPISESLPKSVKERVHRTTRPPKVTPTERNLKPTPKKKGDNDPRRTSRGRKNFKGSKKRKQDEWKRKHPEKFTEALAFYEKYAGQDVSNIMEGLKTIQAPLTLLEFADAVAKKLLDEATTAWSNTLLDVGRTYYSGVGLRIGPVMAKLGDDKSIVEAKDVVESIAGKMRQFFGSAQIFKEEFENNQCILFEVGI
jgi:hypothetical protein